MIRFICGLLALVLVLHIVLVLADANMRNGFAQFVQDFADNVDFGLDNLFTFESTEWRVAVNEGLAALLWLIIGGALGALVARIGTSRVVR